MKPLDEQQWTWIVVQLIVTYCIFQAKGVVLAILANIIFIALIVGAITVWGNYE